MDISHNLEDFGGKEIPDFILKLYTILEKRQFQDIICWAGNGSEIHIKDQKKMQDTILPTYFRHKKIESFIRQLNMYRFSKVNKISKQKKHMFFKNQVFRKGNVKSLHLIKRKRKGQQSDIIEQDRGFQDYKIFIKQNVQRIQDDLANLKKKHPEVSSELSAIINFAGAMTGDSQTHDSSCSQTQEQQDQIVVKQQASRPNLFPSNRNFLNMGFQSLKQFDSRCSIDIFNENNLI